MWNEKYALLENSYKTFVVSRWWRLAPLFIAVQAVAVAYSLAGLPGASDKQDLSIGWWVTQPFIAGSTQFGRLLPPSWSLDVEMQFYVIAPILVSGLAVLVDWSQCDPSARVRSPDSKDNIGETNLGYKRSQTYLFLLFLLAWSVGLFASGVDAETPRCDLYCWLFVTGAVAYFNAWAPARGWQWASLIGMVVLTALVISLPSVRDLVWRAGSSPVANSPGVVNLFFVILAIVGVPLAISTVHRDSPGWDRWFGDLSYPLYLFHWLPRQWYYSQVDWSASAWWNGLLLIVNFSAALIGSIMLLHVVDRPSQRLRGRWLRK